MYTLDLVLRDMHSTSPAYLEEKSNDHGETSCHLTDSDIVMAEQSHHDVVNQTRSDGDPSPSDVPASTSSNQDTGGDVKGVTTKNQLLSNAGRQLGSSDSENTTTGSSGTSGTVSPYRIPQTSSAAEA